MSEKQPEKYRRYIAENQDIPRTTIMRWMERGLHVLQPLGSDSEIEESAGSENSDTSTNYRNDRNDGSGIRQDRIEIPGSERNNDTASSTDNASNNGSEDHSLVLPGQELMEINAEDIEDDFMDADIADNVEYQFEMNSYSDNDLNDFDSDIEDGQEHSDLIWLTDPVYENSMHSIGDTVTQLLQHYFENAQTKKSLAQLLTMVKRLLPQPNKVPKSTYFLMKLLRQIMPSHCNALRKHRFCHICERYLGLWFAQPQVTECITCHSTEVEGMFLEYSIRAFLIDAFQCRKLDEHIDKYNELINNYELNYIYDISCGIEYIKYRQTAIPGRYDVLLEWNTDGAPASVSSNGQIWPQQVQVKNIHPERRRSFQFVVGLYYSMSKKPCMNTVLEPLADAFTDLFNNGVEWFQESTGSMITSKVIAPIATLDAPARATAQNIKQFNGKYGCSFCEHPGETFYTEKGSVHIYPELAVDPPIRTHEGMLDSALKVTSEPALQDDKGVKGPTVTAAIPCFNIATGYVPDYMHSVLKGVLLALIILWTDSRYHREDFYIVKVFRDEIDNELEKIKPPDFVTRTPRTLSNFNFWKASEFKMFLIAYSPILLRGKLEGKYYQHYLLLVEAIRILLQTKMSKLEVDLADTLLHIFATDMQELYGKRHMSFNVHQLRHLAPSVRLWGPLWAWSTFPFEDGNGYLKRITHGPNKVDVEIFNTIKLYNGLLILKHLREMNRATQCENVCQTLGSSKLRELSSNEILALQNVNAAYASNIENNSTFVYYKVKVGTQTFTSEPYTRKTKRNNHTIFWNKKSLYATIKFFVKINNSLYAFVQQLIETRDPRDIIINTATNVVVDCIKPIRETYCTYAIPVEKIEGKLIRVMNYICFLPEFWEKE